MAAVVEALIDLVREGELKPTGSKIAARAGISDRALWANFPDLESVFDATGRVLLERQEEQRAPIPSELPRGERVERFCVQRSALHEAIAPFGRANRRWESFSAALARNRRRFVDRTAAAVEEAFAPELAQAGPQRAGLVEALTACASWAWWSVLRDDRELDAAQATDVLRLTVASVLERAVSDRPGTTPS